ncbi:Long-chain-fatty-acid--CoA ligase [Nocardioides aquaticus]|uniref:Long-chain-fatty-acid--CoA ligase n=1 Tax=Nocardioides aquaticus TaxID=160826 RepID=A0ABX8EES9_9ACTN|nr:Long-chain-fatty-acid--CoA ligase [Nocardioides aquaticus]
MLAHGLWCGHTAPMYPGTWAALHPDKPALVMAGSGRTLTYRELDERSARLARHLHDRGLRTGDVVALVSDNTPEAYEVYWAALRSGLYVTAVNHHLTAAEAAYVVEDCGARALVVSATVPRTPQALAARLGGVRERLAFAGAVEGYADYEAVLAASSPAPLPLQPHGDDLLYSSGTTGRPKGVKPPLPGIAVDEPGYRYVALFGTLYSFTEDTVYLSPAPVYHAAPLRFGGVVHATGGTLVMMERFEPEAFLRAVEEHRVTHTQCVPTMFVRLLKLPEKVRAAADTSSLRVVVHAAAPCPVEVKRAMIDWLGPLVEEYYASTEANGATCIDSAQWLAHPGSVGRALLGTVRVVGEDGAEVATGEVGTIYFERPEFEGAPFSYHNDPERTRATQHPDHPTWTTVGDLGRVDEEGYLYLTDRKAFMVISGGVNIYPQEVEDHFSLHPAVADVAVLGVPDDDLGERLVAFVQPADAAVPGPDLARDLTAFARERMAAYKVPREFLFRATLPRTPTGKMVKGRLQEEYAATR